jgi:phosphate-selective porin OprO/OprP
MRIDCFADKGKSGFDKAWNYLTLYSNDENPTLQQFSLVGRAQIDSVWVNPKTPEEAEKFNDTIWRRLRFGFKADVFDDWVAHLEGSFDLNEPVEDWYAAITDGYIAWAPKKELNIKMLKQSAGFTLDGATSSKRLLTLERNNLTHNLWFTREYFTGVLASGELAETWNYKASFFSSDGDEEWGLDGASWFTLWSLGYKWGHTQLNLAYVFQDEHEEAGTRPFEQILSLTAKWHKDSWGIWGDLSVGKGFSTQEQSDVWGLVVMPFYDFSDHLQCVLRYTYLTSGEDNGIRLNRYENEVVEGRGDTYTEGYAGINVYFYGHKFKWQTGLTWADMTDDAMDGGEYEGLALSTGLRVYW